MIDVALLLNRGDVQKLLNIEDAIDVVEAAFSELASGTATMPDRTVIIDPDVGGWIASMPAYLKSSGALGAKSVTVYKGNPDKFGLPTTLASIILLDQNTGQTVAVMDGGYLTAIRTGAVSGVATRHLARKDASVGAILGAGVQARAQVLAMCASANLEKVVIFAMDPPESVQAFADGLAEATGVTMEVASSTAGALSDADVVALATTAAEPIVDGAWFKPGAHINAIGSHAPGVRELDTATLLRAKVVCDTKVACLNEAGDIQIPIEAGEYSADQIHGDLGDVVNGTIAGRESDDEITLFKSVGLAIQDISCAALVYKKAKEAGAGIEFDFSR
ncbi:MAG: ornithine cyclodeaminase family protein [Chloroflexi bacterium]|nr:ornithine cyclodeaminase family protein [Chloroflexota bacterium]